MGARRRGRGDPALSSNKDKFLDFDKKFLLLIHSFCASLCENSIRVQQPVHGITPVRALYVISYLSIDNVLFIFVVTEYSYVPCVIY